MWEETMRSWYLLAFARADWLEEFAEETLDPACPMAELPAQESERMNQKRALSHDMLIRG